MIRAPLTRRALLLGAGAALVVPTAYAQSTARYVVELIVFRQPGTPPPADAATTMPKVAVQPGRIDVLPQTEWQLANLDGGLRRSSGYRVLAHAAWAATVSAYGSTAARLEDVQQDPALTGAVTVQRGQYLFVRVDLDYATADGGIYQLRERRRVKFNERHYFDHPAIGAIVVVSPTRANQAD
jgi:hypothetical protein